MGRQARAGRGRRMTWARRSFRRPGCRNYWWRRGGTLQITAARFRSSRRPRRPAASPSPGCRAGAGCRRGWPPLHRGHPRRACADLAVPDLFRRSPRAASCCTHSTRRSIALGLNGAAYLAEVYRAGLQAIHAGQREAAQIGRHEPRRKPCATSSCRSRCASVLPPMVQLPGIALLKDTSIASLIAAPELTTARARSCAASTTCRWNSISWPALIYFLMAFPLSRAAKRLEARLARGH